MGDANHHSIDRHHEIQSGQFMISNLEESESEPEENDSTAESDQLASNDKLTGTQPATFDNLNSLLKCLHLANVENLTSPRWSHFKGSRFALKSKIRLNNIIWREYHMQYVKQLAPVVVKFEVSLFQSHNRIEGFVMEGQYWKRHSKVLCNEYRRWRTFFKGQILHHQSTWKVDQPLTTPNIQSIDYVSAFCSSDKHQQINDEDMFILPSVPKCDIIDDLRMDLDGSLDVFSDQPFPNPRDMFMLGNADIIQPGLVQLQPNSDNFHFDFTADFMHPFPDTDNYASLGCNNSSYDYHRHANLSESLTQSFNQSSSSSSPFNLNTDQFISATPSNQQLFQIQNTDKNNDQNFFDYPDLFNSSVDQNFSGSANNQIYDLNTTVDNYVDMSNYNLGNQLEIQSNNKFKELTVPNNYKKKQVSQLVSDQHHHTPALLSALLENKQQISHSRYLSSNTPPEINNWQMGSIKVQDSNFFSKPTTDRSEITMNKIGNSGALIMDLHKDKIQPLENLHTSYITCAYPSMNVYQSQKTTSNEVHPRKYMQSSPSKSTGQTSSSRLSTNYHPYQPPSFSNFELIETNPVNVVLNPVKTFPPNNCEHEFQSPVRQSIHPSQKFVTIIKPTTQPQFLQQPTDPHFQSSYQPIIHPDPVGLVTNRRSSSHSNLHTDSICSNSYNQIYNQQFDVCNFESYVPPEKPFQVPLTLTDNNRNSNLSAPNLYSNSFQPTFNIIETDPLESDRSNYGSLSCVSGYYTPEATDQKLDSSIDSYSAHDFENSPELLNDSINGPLATNNQLEPFTSKNNVNLDNAKSKYCESTEPPIKNSEQRRRVSIQSSLKVLHELIVLHAKPPDCNVRQLQLGRYNFKVRRSPISGKKRTCSNDHLTLKSSKANILKNAANLIKSQRQERYQLDCEIIRLQQQITNLRASIDACCKQMPSSSSVASHQTSEQESEARTWFKQYTSSVSQTNWKFYIFSLIMNGLFESYMKKVKISSKDCLRKSTFSWLDENCPLSQLRPFVTEAMCKLSNTTNILHQPHLLPQQAKQAAARMAMEFAPVTST